MFQQQLCKVGDSYVVTVPHEVVEQLGLVEGQVLRVEVQPIEREPGMNPELREAFEASWKRSEAAYRYLKDR